MSRLKTLRDKLHSLVSREPERRPAVPDIQGDDDVDALLQELSYMVSMGLALQALWLEELTERKQEDRGYLTAKLDDGSSVSHADRTQQIEDALEVYFRDNPDALPGNKKSRKFTFGTCGFRIGRGKHARIDYAEDYDAQKLTYQLLSEFGLAERAKEMLDAVELWEDGPPLSAIADLQITLNFDVIKSMFAGGKLNREHLKRLNLSLIDAQPSQERFFAKPVDYQSRPEPATAS